MRPISATFVALYALLPALHILARQIPVIDGVIGGVPRDTESVIVETSVSPAATTPGKLRVIENSGVCETTPGVYQASGYGDLTSSESIWYDLFNIVGGCLFLIFQLSGFGFSLHARTLLQLRSLSG